MVMRREHKPQTPKEALETAYWLNWCGDTKYARALLMRITDFVLTKEGSYEPETTYSQQAKPQKGTTENYPSADEHLIR